MEYWASAQKIIRRWFDSQNKPQRSVRGCNYLGIFCMMEAWKLYSVLSEMFSFISLFVCLFLIFLKVLVWIKLTEKETSEHLPWRSYENKGRVVAPIGDARCLQTGVRVAAHFWPQTKTQLNVFEMSSFLLQTCTCNWVRENPPPPK